jgi:Heme oxygenase
MHSHPHTLLAYTWIMYLALFNGGRWIRTQLLSSSAAAAAAASCPSHFWPYSSDAKDCLTFWSFDGEDDGEDLKDKFKAKFDALSSELSEEERQDVILEAVEIFKMCGKVVEGLDREFAATRVIRSGAFESLSALLTLPHVLVLTSQLYGVLVWVWGLVLGPVSKGQREISVGQRMQTREQAHVRVR